MSVLIDNETELDAIIPVEEIASRVVEKCVMEMGFPYPYHVDILITDEESMAMINEEQRGIASSTDVLSFPYVNFATPGGEPDEDSLSIDCDTDEVQLGQIVVCDSVLLAHAKEYGHSPEREFAFLIAHSMLHLFGYDHMTKEEEKEMFTLQERYLNELHYVREGDLETDNG